MRSVQFDRVRLVYLYPIREPLFLNNAQCGTLFSHLIIAAVVFSCMYKRDVKRMACKPIE